MFSGAFIVKSDFAFDKLIFVGATIGRPPELWLNHNFDICFLYKKLLVNRLNFDKTNGRIFYRLQAAVCRSPLQKQLSDINEDRILTEVAYFCSDSLKKISNL